MRLCAPHDAEVVSALAARGFVVPPHRTTMRRYLFELGPDPNSMTAETFDPRLVAYGTILALAVQSEETDQEKADLVGWAARCPFCLYPWRATEGWVRIAADATLGRFKAVSVGHA